MLSPRIKILQFFVALLQCGCQRCLLLLAGLILANNVQSAIDEIKVVEQNSASVGAAGVTPTNIVLPGFEPLTARDGVISLGVGRKYSFLDGFLFDAMTFKDKRVVGPMLIEAEVNGKLHRLAAAQINLQESSEAVVTYQAEGSVVDSLNMRVITSVEYDGLARVNIQLSASQPVVVDNLRVVMPVVRYEHSVVMGFKADTVRKRVKELIAEVPYKGEFLNAIGVSQGDHSFWWIADNAEGWIWNGDAVTEIEVDGNELRIIKNLIGDSWTIDHDMEFKFSVMLTPVKSLDNNWRTDRVVRAISHEEAAYGKYQIWWTTAFAHQNLPYTEYPDGVRDKIPPPDIEVYPGLSENRLLLREWTDIGIHRLPYFSAHTLSGFDPAFLENREDWAVSPPFVMPAKSDRPFVATLRKPWLSHRAPGYSDYVLENFSRVIDELGIEGMYFDQGGVIQSDNPAHGLWYDSNGEPQASTDILAMRDFFKRLATLFHLKGKDGAIFVHNSMSPIAPAYSFVTSMVQGEEYVQYLNNLDYIASTPMDLARAKFAGGQYGVRVDWLSELWSSKIQGGRSEAMPLSEWTATKEYKKALRNFIALAMLHDAPMIYMAPFDTKKTLYDNLDHFWSEQSVFHGYWEREFIEDSDQILISYYSQSSKSQRYLMVVANISEQEKILNASQLAEHVGQNVTECEHRVSPDAKAEDNYIMPAKDFVLYELDCTSTVRDFE